MTKRDQPDMKLLLGSQSPRRKELLQSLNIDFESVTVECDETYPSDVKLSEIAAYLAEKKSLAYRHLRENEILVTSDTVVILDNEVLGKPEDAVHSREMLRKLSGRTHEVHTAVTLRSSAKKVTRCDVAKVHVNEISASEIEFYIENYHPFDKAGSYGIQEWLGLAKVNRIEGSFYTIMGLPTHLIYEILQDFSV